MVDHCASEVQRHRDGNCKTVTEIDAHPLNWLRVFGHAEATHIAQGVRQRLRTLEGRPSNAWHPFADRGTDIDVVTACCVYTLLVQ